MAQKMASMFVQANKTERTMENLGRFLTGQSGWQAVVAAYTSYWTEGMGVPGLRQALRELSNEKSALEGADDLAYHFGTTPSSAEKFLRKNWRRLRDAMKEEAARW